jgi:hypothetical protein
MSIRSQALDGQRAQPTRSIPDVPHQEFMLLGDGQSRLVPFCFSCKLILHLHWNRHGSKERTVPRRPKSRQMRHRIHQHRNCLEGRLTRTARNLHSHAMVKIPRVAIASAQIRTRACFSSRGPCDLAEEVPR